MKGRGSELRRRILNAPFQGRNTRQIFSAQIEEHQLKYETSCVNFNNFEQFRFQPRIIHYGNLKLSTSI